ncbi:MAG: hypothetical protein ACLU7Z_07245 [Eggerthellaceae bacterium]
MADITSIAPYEAVTVNDTTDETRTDLPALIQRMENQIALQNQVIRQFLEHWDSISQMERFRFTAMPLDVEYANATGNGYMPMVKWHFGDHARGLILGDDGITYANFDDRSQDKKASWTS